MSRPIRLLTALMTLVVALVWVLPSRSVAAPLNATASASAASYVVSQLKTDASGKYLEALPYGGTVPEPSPSYTAEGVIALVAAGGYATEVAAMDAWLKTKAASYATSSGAAAKLVLAAVAAGSDPRSYGGVDLVSKITADANGSLTAWGGDAFTQSLGILALVRAGAPVPANVSTYLLSLQGPDGSFGYTDYNTGAYVADADTTAIALQALAALAPTNPAAKAAAVKARDYLLSTRSAGYWPNVYSPSNTAGYAGTALMLVGSDVSSTVSWLATQQQPDGGLPATLDGSPSDLYATLQGMLLFAGESLLSVGPGGVDRVSLAVASSSAPVSSAPVSSVPVSSAPVSSAPVSSAPVSSAPVSSAPVSSAPASSAPVSSAPVSSAPVSSAPVSSAPVSSAPASSTPVASASSAVTTAAASSTPARPGSSSAPLPGTGSDVPPAAIFGAALALLAGVALTIAGRRRA